MNMHEFAVHLRELPCEKCPVSLRCMMGRPDNDAIFCQVCQSWWVAGQNVSIHCGKFHNLQMQAHVHNTLWKERCPYCRGHKGTRQCRGTPVGTQRVTC